MQVLKIGGNELDDPGFLAGLADYMAGTAVPHIIVHGGGRAIVALQQKVGLHSTKVDGLRVTDREMINVVQMALSGQTNKQIVTALLAAGVDAIGLSGVDGGILRCQKKRHPTADLGYVGEISQVRTELLHQLTHLGLTVVLSPLSLGFDGYTYNVNADDTASAVASALQAERLTFVSNVPGVLQDGRILPQLTLEQTESLIHDGIITDGMVPKVRAALATITQGVHQTQIVNLAGLLNNSGTIFTNEAII
ncbi:acetylglutamate kinase [Candidatus Leptofilum sp.]|uniref:acetylglutamate kinase n=1 Tax=Candidatus Leptofilum sp. TaxID=3241576 RepID=UPI003B5A0DEB